MTTKEDYEVIKKYESVFKQYENTIAKILEITMMPTPYMKQAIIKVKKQIQENITKKDKYFDN